MTVRRTCSTAAAFAPLLLEDAFPCVEGPSLSAVHPTLDAISLTLITRSDQGRNTLNGALLLGYAIATGMTPAYYPPRSESLGVCPSYAADMSPARRSVFPSMSSQTFR